MWRFRTRQSTTVNHTKSKHDLPILSPYSHPAFWKACKRFALKPVGSFFVFNFFTRLRLRFAENCGANLSAIFLGNDVAFLAHHEVVSCSAWPNGSETLKNQKNLPYLSAEPKVKWQNPFLSFLQWPTPMALSLPHHVQIKLIRQIRQIFFRFLAVTRGASLPQLVTHMTAVDFAGTRIWLRKRTANKS